MASRRAPSSTCSPTFSTRMEMRRDAPWAWRSMRAGHCWSPTTWATRSGASAARADWRARVAVHARHERVGKHVSRARGHTEKEYRLDELELHQQKSSVHHASID